MKPSLPRPSMPPGRWLSAAIGSTGPQPVSAGRCACGRRKARPCSGTGRHIPTRPMLSLSTRTDARWSAGAGMTRSSYGTWRAVPCSGRDGIPRAHSAWPLPPMDVHSPAGEMTRPSGSGTTRVARPCRHCRIPVRSSRGPGARMGACSPVEAPRDRFGCVRVIQGYATSLFDIDWSPDGTQLVSGGTNTLVTIWDVAGGTSPSVLRGHRWIVHGVAWSPDGRLLASSGWDNTIGLWDAATGACLQLLRDPAAADTIFQGVAWSPDGRLLACGSYLRGVQVWDVTARTRRWVGRAYPTKIRRVASSPDGTRLASGGDDGSVCLWDASDGTLLQRLQGHSGMVASVAWSPDGTRLASGGGGRGSEELLVWDAHSGECVRALAGHAGLVFAVAWMKLGDLLVSGESDGMLRWWDVQSGECMRIRAAHQGTIQSLRASPDGQRLATYGHRWIIML